MCPQELTMRSNYTMDNLYNSFPTVKNIIQIPLSLTSLFVIFLFTAIPNTSYSYPFSGTEKCESIATLTQTDGQVSIKPANSIRRYTPDKTPISLCENDTIITFKGAAKLKSNTSEITISSHSKVKIQSSDAELLSGKSYFLIDKVAHGETINFTTRLATIGVKGTSFLISDDGKTISVTMNEGEVSLTPKNGTFKLYEKLNPLLKESQESLEEQYQAFIREKEQGVNDMLNAFDSWVTQNEEAFRGYVNNLSLSKNKEVMVQGNTAIKQNITSEKIDEMNWIKNLFKS